MGDPWDAAYEDELHVSQEIADLVEEACDARSSSSDLEEEELQQKCWWIAMLEGALADLHYTWPTIQRQKLLRVMSACSGCSAESEVMKDYPGTWTEIQALQFLQGSSGTSAC